MFEVEAMQLRPRTQQLALTRRLLDDPALALIQQTALEVFGTRRLDKHLGCQAMGIHHHFSSMAHVLGALVDCVLAATQIALRR